MPISASNFTSNSLSGAVFVSGGNVAVTLTPVPYALEGDKSFVIKIRRGSTQGTVLSTSAPITLKDRTTLVSLTANTATVAEGNLVAFSLVTTNVVNGVTVYYSVFPASANVNADDFTGNTGSVVITNNTATFALQANINIAPVDETGENFRVQLRTNSTTGNVVFATSNITILDTYKTYNIISLVESSASQIVEGSNVTFTFTATNIPTGTIFYYNTVGNVTSFSSNTGSFALNSISNTFVISNPQVPYSASRSFNVILRSDSASGPIVATSNTITIIDDSLASFSASGGSQSNVAGYTIHTFTTSSNVTFTKNGTIEYLVVAGGGGGGAGYYGGGGGAGGYLTATGLSVTAGQTSVTVGAGGTGSASVSSVRGGVGSNSVISSITSVGGGGGGSYNEGNPGPTIKFGGDGGSGGGGSAGPNNGGSGGTGTPGQGNPGGSFTNFGPSPSGSGGGGGAGAAGTGASQSVNSPGGVGLQSSITGSATYYAGGGGAGKNSTGSTGGLGGGGDGGGFVSPGPTGFPGIGVATAGTVNTGGGGGGGGNYVTAGSGPTINTGIGRDGGSGIVIIKYITISNTAAFVNITTPTTFIYEGSNVVFGLNTRDVANNTLLYYYTVGNVLSSHFVSGNTGSFRTTENSTNITLPTNSTIPTNEERSFQLVVTNEVGTSGDNLLTSNVFTIKDSNLQPFNAEGGTLVTANGYNTHTFTASGNITFTKTGTIEYLVVAGGGGGGNGNGAGGGGAGGYLTATGFAVNSGTFTVTVGAGGAGGDQQTGARRNGQRGSNSILFGAITAIQGGGGAGSGNETFNGGSGGGGSGYGYTSTGGTGIPGQGNNGGAGRPFSAGTESGGGGGGGAATAGNSATTADGIGATGGAGLISSISGANVTYAGGGGGYVNGAGGSGGGGKGAFLTQAGNPGTVNTGGGGGAGGQNDSAPGGQTWMQGGNGGSGIVIIRYPV
jgi:hypothetical protein